MLRMMTITMKMFIYPVHYDKKTKLTSLKKSQYWLFSNKKPTFLLSVKILAFFYSSANKALVSFDLK